jgi:alkylation response protein AidB-like acyl-CoA dehydrogenase
MRVVQNGDIVLTGVVVPEANRLPKCASFKDATGALAASRLIVAWQPVGMVRAPRLGRGRRSERRGRDGEGDTVRETPIRSPSSLHPPHHLRAWPSQAMGVFDACLRYTSERRQFGAPLNSLAINQEKLMRMLATVQGMLLVAWRVTRLAEAGRATPGMTSLAKGSLTARGREVAALGRELLGGNGILHDFHCAKVFNDMEAVHTYEVRTRARCAGRIRGGFALSQSRSVWGRSAGHVRDQHVGRSARSYRPGGIQAVLPH